MGGMRRRGIQLLLMVLPDGSRSLISVLGVLDQTPQLVGGLSAAAKLFGQPQHACAFCEPVRDCPHHADLEDYAEPKSRF